MTTIEDRVRKLIVEFLDPPEDFNNDTPFVQLGSDSLLMMELVMEVEDEFGLEIDDATVTEAKKRDYKAEYKKFQSSTKSKKYRAELNKYNRQKGTYGNGDGKDAAHTGPNRAKLQSPSKNRANPRKGKKYSSGKGRKIA